MDATLLFTFNKNVILTKKMYHFERSITI